jgi:hypothetical protein
MGVIAALLLATGHIDRLAVPLWVKFAADSASTRTAVEELFG